jgi:hypothetical protein
MMKEEEKLTDVKAARERAAKDRRILKKSSS